MPDVSPTRWHLAHTTWFFETFLLRPFCPNFEPQNAAFAYLFNSYYNTVGEQYPRARRGLLSRPTVEQVWAYRKVVDDRVSEFLAGDDVSTEAHRVVELGLHHEQQHQELILTDIKHVLSCNPLYPVYQAAETSNEIPAGRADWLAFQGGIKSVGFQGDGFCFDNELPRHPTLLQDYQLQDQLVTNGDYLEFMLDDGYARPKFWLSMGWTALQEASWRAPLYWVERDGSWCEFTLSGLRSIDLTAPVTHVSYFEADAFARWAGKRLPTEFEWEHAAHQEPIEGNFAEAERFHPTAAAGGNGLQQCFGDVWEWTSSQYTAYPGYKPPAGALGEYNGKFMCNQFVLRGGSCATSQSHVRPSYRNFFPPDARWQFSGIRLAQ